MSIANLYSNHLPLFLEHPEYSAHVHTVSHQLGPTARLTLQCYYTAAVSLAIKHHPGGIPLPDVFSEELGINLVDDQEVNLQALAKRHKELSGSLVNWLATYHHAEQVWRKGLEY